MKILYFCPDAQAPSGGVRRIYTHVSLLTAGGYDARVLHHKRGYRYPWADDPAPVVYLADIQSLAPDTVLVVPEGFPDILRSFPGCPKAVIALNPYHIFNALPRHQTWRDLGVNWVLTPSRVTAEFIRWSMGMEEIHLLGTWVDEELFWPCAEKKHQVAVVRRKDSLTPLVAKILAARFGPKNRVDFKIIDNLHITDYAAVLRESAVFLTTSVFEGVNRSVLEAMACGCVCVGFAGIGGKDYMIGAGPDQNFVLADGMDVVDLSYKLARTVERVRENDPEVEKIRKNALATARRMTKESEQQALFRFWEKVAAQTGG